MVTKTVAESAVESREMVLPNDTNLFGNLLGGTLLHLVDVVGAMAASRHANSIVATVCIDSMDFTRPIKLGEFVIIKARLTWVGRTSMEVLVEAFSENYIEGTLTPASKAYVTFVSLDKEGKPCPVPKLELVTEAERADFAEGEKRRAARLARLKRSN